MANVNKFMARKKEIPRIIVPQGKITALSKHFGVSVYTVRRALKYDTESELAGMIRKEALKNYGGSETVIKVSI